MKRQQIFEQVLERDPVLLQTLREFPISPKNFDWQVKLKFVSLKLAMDKFIDRLAFQYSY